MCFANAAQFNEHALKPIPKVSTPRLQLQVGVPVVRAGGVNAMFVCDDLPELRADLISALTCRAPSCHFSAFAAVLVWEKAGL